MIADNQHMVNAMHCNELQSHAGPAGRCRALPERQWEASVLGRLNTLIDGIGVFVSSDCGSNGGGNVASATCRSANIAKCPQKWGHGTKILSERTVHGGGENTRFRPSDS